MKRQFLSMRTFAIVGGLAVAMLALSACNKFDNDDNPNQDVAGLMAFNLSADQPAVGFALSGNNLTDAPLAFNSFTGRYLPIYPGNRNVQSYVFYNNKLIASNDQVFQPGKYYSTFLVGADSNYRNVTTIDDFDTLNATAGQAFIRYINAIPDSAAPTVSITANGSSVVNESAAFASLSEFKAVPAGSVSVGINNGGTINKSRDITLTERKVYTALLIGKPGSNTGDSIQIRYVENGTLSEATVQQRISASGNTTTGN